MTVVLAAGRVSRAPEFKTSQAGKPFCRFSLACDNRFAGKPEWVSCVAFGQMAETARQCREGQFVFVQGRLSTTSYEKDGQKRWSTSVVVDQMEFPEAPTRRHREPGEDDSTPF